MILAHLFFLALGCWGFCWRLGRGDVHWAGLSLFLALLSAVNLVNLS